MEHSPATERTLESTFYCPTCQRRGWINPTALLNHAYRTHNILTKPFPCRACRLVGFSCENKLVDHLRSGSCLGPDWEQIWIGKLSKLNSSRDKTQDESSDKENSCSTPRQMVKTISTKRHKNPTTPSTIDADDVSNILHKKPILKRPSESKSSKPNSKSTMNNGHPHNAKILKPRERLSVPSKKRPLSSPTCETTPAPKIGKVEPLPTTVTAVATTKTSPVENDPETPNQIGKKDSVGGPLLLDWNSFICMPKKRHRLSLQPRPRASDLSLTTPNSTRLKEESTVKPRQDQSTDILKDIASSKLETEKCSPTETVVSKHVDSLNSLLSNKHPKAIAGSSVYPLRGTPKQNGTDTMQHEEELDEMIPRNRRSKRQSGLSHRVECDSPRNSATVSIPINEIPCPENSITSARLDPNTSIPSLRTDTVESSVVDQSRPTGHRKRMSEARLVDPLNTIIVSDRQSRSTPIKDALQPNDIPSVASRQSATDTTSKKKKHQMAKASLSLVNGVTNTPSTHDSKPHKRVTSDASTINEAAKILFTEPTESASLFDKPMTRHSDRKPRMSLRSTPRALDHAEPAFLLSDSHRDTEASKSNDLSLWIIKTQNTTSLKATAPQMDDPPKSTDTVPSSSPKALMSNGDVVEPFSIGSVSDKVPVPMKTRDSTEELMRPCAGQSSPNIPSKHSSSNDVSVSKKAKRKKDGKTKTNHELPRKEQVDVSDQVSQVSESTIAKDVADNEFNPQKTAGSDVSEIAESVKEVGPKLKDQGVAIKPSPRRQGQLQPSRDSMISLRTRPSSECPDEHVEMKTRDSTEELVRPCDGQSSPNIPSRLSSSNDISVSKKAKRKKDGKPKTNQTSPRKEQVDVSDQVSQVSESTIAKDVADNEFNPQKTAGSDVSEIAESVKEVGPKLKDHGIAIKPSPRRQGQLQPSRDSMISLRTRPSSECPDEHVESQKTAPVKKPTITTQKDTSSTPLKQSMIQSIKESVQKPPASQHDTEPAQIEHLPSPSSKEIQSVESRGDDSLTQEAITGDIVESPSLTAPVVSSETEATNVIKTPGSTGKPVERNNGSSIRRSRCRSSSCNDILVPDKAGKPQRCASNDTTKELKDDTVGSISPSRRRKKQQLTRISQRAVEPSDCLEETVFEQHQSVELGSSPPLESNNHSPHQTNTATTNHVSPSKSSDIPPSEEEPQQTLTTLELKSPTTSPSEIVNDQRTSVKEETPIKAGDKIKRNRRTANEAPPIHTSTNKQQQTGSTFKCFNCPRVFPNMRALGPHRRSCQPTGKLALTPTIKTDELTTPAPDASPMTKLDVWKCPICLRLFHNKGGFGMHRRSCHPSDQVSRAKLSNVPTSPNTPSTPVTTETSQSITNISQNAEISAPSLECPSCSLSFPTSDALNSHATSCKLTPQYSSEPSPKKHEEIVKQTHKVTEATPLKAISLQSALHKTTHVFTPDRSFGRRRRSCQSNEKLKSMTAGESVNSLDNNSTSPTPSTMPRTNALTNPMTASTPANFQCTGCSRQFLKHQGLMRHKRFCGRSSRASSIAYSQSPGDVDDCSSRNSSPTTTISMRTTANDTMSKSSRLPVTTAGSIPDDLSVTSDTTMPLTKESGRHTPRNNQQCLWCQDCFGSLRLLTIHRSRCPARPKSFPRSHSTTLSMTTRRVLKNQSKLSLSIRLWSCTSCGMQFRSRAVLYSHLATECSKSLHADTTTESNGQSKMACPGCPRNATTTTYASTEEVLAHLLSLKPNSGHPYANHGLLATSHCWPSFVAVPNLGFGCHICGQLLASESRLDKHKRAVHERWLQVEQQNVLTPSP